MIEIKDLLSKFDNILVKGGLKVELIREALYEVLGIEVKREDVKIKNNIIYLNIKPIYKNEILIRQEEIYNILLKRIGEKAPKKIR
ncbi:MAG: hypothetical protein AAB510_03200 [Patescibacteria group bacterium]